MNHHQGLGLAITRPPTIKANHEAMACHGMKPRQATQPSPAIPQQALRFTRPPGATGNAARHRRRRPGHGCLDHDPIAPLAALLAAVQGGYAAASADPNDNDLAGLDPSIIADKN